ncbi:17726_t:CDS:10 [Acaulospora morrowiae]|uniref:17726_t:CDS:1 n=1 Tax=Acaulospora morrowiae TaxID=94023 RepID=A0A9N9ACT7_9GLOM|nr:17726_t:CDS:10 [Acaulospora morrowiae]
MSGDDNINFTSSSEEETHVIQYERDTVEDLKVSDLFHSQHKKISQVNRERWAYFSYIYRAFSYIGIAIYLDWTIFIRHPVNFFVITLHFIFSIIGLLLVGTCLLITETYIKYFHYSTRKRIYGYWGNDKEHKEYWKNFNEYGNFKRCKNHFFVESRQDSDPCDPCGSCKKRRDGESQKHCDPCKKISDNCKQYYEQEKKHLEDLKEGLRLACRFFDSLEEVMGYFFSNNQSDNEELKTKIKDRRKKLKDLIKEIEDNDGHQKIWWQNTYNIEKLEGLRDIIDECLQDPKNDVNGRLKVPNNEMDNILKDILEDITKETNDYYSILEKDSTEIDNGILDVLKDYEEILNQNSDLEYLEEIKKMINNDFLKKLTEENDFPEDIEEENDFLEKLEGENGAILEQNAEDKESDRILKKAIEKVDENFEILRDGIELLDDEYFEYFGNKMSDKNDSNMESVSDSHVKDLRDVSNDTRVCNKFEMLLFLATIIYKREDYLIANIHKNINILKKAYHLCKCKKGKNHDNDCLKLGIMSKVKDYLKSLREIADEYKENDEKKRRNSSKPAEENPHEHKGEKISHEATDEEIFDETTGEKISHETTDDGISDETTDDGISDETTDDGIYDETKDEEKLFNEKLKWKNEMHKLSLYLTFSAFWPSFIKNLLSSTKPLTDRSHAFEMETLGEIREHIKEIVEYNELHINNVIKQVDSDFRFTSISELNTDDGGSFCGMFYNKEKNFIAVVFKGTTPDNYGEWLSNLTFQSVDARSFLFGQVHRGFYNYLFPMDGKEHVRTSRNFPYKRIVDTIKAKAEEIKRYWGKKGLDRKVNLWITGHSLGGGLAVLFYARLLKIELGILKDVCELRDTVTFASPAVGDSHFAVELNFYINKLNENHPLWRFVLKEDIVPKLPYRAFSKGMRKYGYHSNVLMNYFQVGEKVVFHHHKNKSILSGKFGKEENPKKPESNRELFRYKDDPTDLESCLEKHYDQKNTLKRSLIKTFKKFNFLAIPDIIEQHGTDSYINALSAYRMYHLKRKEAECQKKEDSKIS